MPVGTRHSAMMRRRGRGLFVLAGLQQTRIEVEEEEGEGGSDAEFLQRLASSDREKERVEKLRNQRKGDPRKGVKEGPGVKDGR